MFRPRPLPLVAFSVLLALLLAAPARAGGRDRPELLVTLAARVCPAYTDITANRARNNIMESLRDLGRTRPTAPVSRSIPPWRRASSRAARRCRTGASRSARGIALAR